MKKYFKLKTAVHKFAFLLRCKKANEITKQCNYVNLRKKILAVADSVSENNIIGDANSVYTIERKLSA